MLNLSKVHQAVQVKASFIKLMQEQSQTAIGKYLDNLEILTQTAPEDFNNKVVASKEVFAGALATDELIAGLVHPLACALTNQSEVNNWKMQVLAGRITVAIDGSQIEPDKNLGLFFGAVQVGWFLNYHNNQITPAKNLDFEIVLPKTFKEEDQELRQEIFFKRFQKETYTLALIIGQLAKQGFKKRPIAFFDGSLTLSFVSSQARKKDYMEAVAFLLDASERTEIPVVGFIDTSLAHNLSKSLEQAHELSESANKASDANLLSFYLRDWGDRSAFFSYFDRSFDEVGEKNILDALGFCYLKTGSKKGKPARLELPNWVYKAGILDEVIEVVMAECLVGNGYPYPIEVADSIAVIQNQEREAFYEYIAKMEDLSLGQSAKLRSKQIRRRPKIVV
jgi:hypothetical protein